MRLPSSIQLPGQLRLVAGAGLFLALLPLLGLSQIELARQRMAGLTRHRAEAYRMPPPGALRALSFGYNELAADLLWVRTIAYFSDHLGKDNDLRHLGRHLRNIVALDPRFKKVYRFGSSMMMSQGHRQTNETVMEAIALLRRGHEQFPNEWEFPFYIGSYYLNELRSPSGDQRAAWRRRAADWLHTASLLGGGKQLPWLPTLAAKIYEEQGRSALAIEMLKGQCIVLPREARGQCLAKLRQMKASRAADEVARGAETLERSRRRSQLGFVPLDLYALVGQEPLPPFSLEQQVSAP